MKNIIILAAIIGIASQASAVIISNPLSLSTQFLAGIRDGQVQGPGGSSIENELIIAQAILDLSLGEVDPPYSANTVFDYAGTITSNSLQLETGINGDATIDIPAGWGGALVKYDGPNAGYALFLFGGTASTIPEFPYNLWTTNEEQYQASHYVLLSGTGGLTPGPQTTVPEGGVGIALFGLALAGMGLAKFRK